MGAVCLMCKPARQRMPQTRPAELVDLQQNDCCCELTKKAEPHSNRSDLRWEDLADPKIHCSITSGALEGQVDC